MTSMVFMMLFGPKITLTRLTHENTAKRGTEDLTIDFSDFSNHILLGPIVGQDVAETRMKEPAGH